VATNFKIKVEFRQMNALSMMPRQVLPIQTLKAILISTRNKTNSSILLRLRVWATEGYWRL